MKKLRAMNKKSLIQTPSATPIPARNPFDMEVSVRAIKMGPNIIAKVSP